MSTDLPIHDKIKPPHRLRQRAGALWAIRTFFAQRDYVELDPPIAVMSPGMEVHLDAFELSATGSRRYLHTSPEYALKRLMGLGFERLFALTRCFRDEPPSPTHAPEFTMLEWYRAGAALADLMDEVEALIAAVAQATHGSTTLTYQGTRLCLTPPFERLSVREAFLRHAGVDPWRLSTACALRRAGRAAGVSVPTQSDDWDDVFFQIFLNAVEPNLGRSRPTLLFGYPASQSALARIDPADPATALRFELYAGGLELANAFDELRDPVEQRRRFEADQLARARLGRAVYPIDEALLAALPKMPPTCGIALGFDRLVMLVSDAVHIDEVVVQPWALKSADGGGSGA